MGGFLQILNAEELKRRNCMQGMAARSTGQLQVDTTNDTGLSTRQPTPRMGSEASLGGDMEGAEAEDASNQNTHYRHMLRMSSMSPSSESPFRRTTYFQHNVVTYIYYFTQISKMFKHEMPFLFIQS